MANTVSKIRGQEQASGYPHPEGLLGDSMIKYGHELGGASSFGETSYLQLFVDWTNKSKLPLYTFTCTRVNSTAFKECIEYR